MNEQEKFWADDYARNYIAKNKSFDRPAGSRRGRRCSPSPRTSDPSCNRAATSGATSISSKKSCRRLAKASFNGAIEKSRLKPGSFDLTFSIGVLIHTQPDNLLRVMQKMFDYSSRYVLMREYFNRTPVMLEHRGHNDRLFKRDFDKLFIENFPVRHVDYGFLWGHLYDHAGLDDITWWLFEKDT